MWRFRTCCCGGWAFVFGKRLALDAAGGVALGQAFDFWDADAVEIAGDALLEGGGCGGKFDGCWGVVASEQGVDEPGCKRVAAADPVHQLQAVRPGEMALAASVEQAAPVIFAGGAGAAQRDGHLRKAEAVCQLPGDGSILLGVQLTPGQIAAGGSDAEDIPCIGLIADAHIRQLAQLPQDPVRLGTAPELLPVIEIAGDAHALGLCGLARRPAGLCHWRAQGRGDAGEVEPAVLRIAGQSGSSGCAWLMAEPARSYRQTDARCDAPFSRKYSPIRAPPRTMPPVATPRARRLFTAAWPRALWGSFVINVLCSPKFASETATLASPPPNVASSRGDWSSRS